MERFLNYFGIHGDEAADVLLFGQISPEWTCSHHRRDCLMWGMCARQFFQTCCEMAVDHAEWGMADQLVKIASTALHDKDRVWLNLLKSLGILNNQYKDEVQIRIDDIYRKYVEVGVRADFQSFRKRRRPMRTYTDDSFSLIHCFYLPYTKDGIVPVTGFSRFKNIGVAFYDDQVEFQLASFRDRSLEIRTDVIKDEIGEVIPRCKYTGVRNPIRYLMFIPQRLQNCLDDIQFAKKVFRHAQHDAKLIQSIDTRLFSRLMMQRFGLKNATEEILHQFVIGRLEWQGGETSIGRNRILSMKDYAWEQWCIPLTISKLMHVMRISLNIMFDWFNSGDLCQNCFLFQMGFETVVIIDTRLSDLCGCNEVFLARNYRHDVEQMPRMRDLRPDELFRRMGCHWVAQEVPSSLMATMIVMEEVHKMIRADQHWETPAFRSTMLMLARVMLYWKHGSVERTQLFRLLCFAIFGTQSDSDGRYIDWDDLGEFLNRMLKVEPFSMSEDTDSYVSAFKLMLLFMQSSNTVAVHVLEEAFQTLPLISREPETYAYAI
uniref:Non-structural protein NS1 n=4 Tax=Palyam virus TaxID=40059 RepID=A0A4P9JFK6_9REOV|nr:NS1 [Palyam virus]QCU80182.1 NS1 [Palyam virus]QCU80183.1 NS1 [Palyam virus]QCU80188.1 NS1 [Palyam virus]QCU80189.1 NS1 [Palyam virus]